MFNQSTNIHGYNNFEISKFKYISINCEKYCSIDRNISVIMISKNINVFTNFNKLVFTVASNPYADKCLLFNIIKFNISYIYWSLPIMRTLLLPINIISSNASLSI
jgi:hypothetical protein